MYQITTSVSRKNSDNTGNDISIRVFMLIDSKSNLAKAYTPINIDNTDDFFYYFSDSTNEYSDSLKTALRLLQAGYLLTVMNVRECKHHLTGRIYNNFKYEYFDENEEYKELNSQINDSSNLAIKINVDSMADGSYILLGQNIRGVQCNTLIYVSEEGVLPPITDNNYMFAIRIPPGLKTEERCKYLRDKLSTNSYFTTKLSLDLYYLSVASPYSFNNISSCYNCDSPVYDSLFQAEYISRIYYSDRVIDFISKYTSDINDLKVKISMKGGEYIFNIYRYNGDTISISETITGTADEIIDNINNQSTLITVSANGSFSNVLLGEYQLTNEHTASTVNDNNYTKALEILKEYKENEENEDGVCDIVVNIVYEPDVCSLINQTLLTDIFPSDGYPIIKMFNYYGTGDEINNNLASYFSVNTYYYNNEIYYTKELYLILLINNKLKKNNDDIEIKTEYINRNTFEYLNTPIKNPGDYELGMLQVVYNKKSFDVLEFLAISLINYLVRLSNKSDISMYSIIDQVNMYFSNTFSYSSNISLKSYSKVNNKTVRVAFNYSVNDPTDIKLLELNLDL